MTEIVIPANAKRWLAIVAIAAGVVIALWAIVSQKSDEELIRDQLERLTQVVRVENPDENPLFRGKRVKEVFDDVFTESVKVDVRELTHVTTGREELVRVATRAGSTYRRADAELDDVNVKLDAQKTGAKVDASFVLTAERGSEPERDVRRVAFDFVKRDDEWRITSVVVQPKNE